jgi:hypothetical protein
MAKKQGLTGEIAENAIGWDALAFIEQMPRP